MIKPILDTGASSALNQQPHDGFAARQRGLMQRRGMSMIAFGVVAIGVFTGV